LQYLFPPKLHLLALLVKQVDVILVGKIIMLPNYIYSKQVDDILAGKTIMLPILHPIVLLGKWVDVILAGKIIMPPNLHLLKTSICNFGGQNNHAAKITSTCFTLKTSRCNFGG
jgi:hypothetical protein